MHHVNTIWLPQRRLRSARAGESRVLKVRTCFSVSGHNTSNQCSVSSSSSSEDESLSSKQSSSETEDAKSAADVEPAAAEKPAVPVSTIQKPTINPEQAFDEFYLRQATSEFANDLDKLRSAGDFNSRSVALLVGALKQGGACFRPEERARIGGAGGGREG